MTLSFQLPEPQRSVSVTEVVATVGSPYLAWVCNASEDEVAALTDSSVIPPTWAVAFQTVRFLLEQSTETTPVEFVLDPLGRWNPANACSVTNSLRLTSGGSVPQPTATSPLERSLQELAADIGPMFLLPEGRVSFGRAIGIHTHPAKPVFEDHVRNDAVLMKLFPSETKHGGTSGMWWFSIGSGGTHQLSMLAEEVIRTAVATLRAEDRFDPEALMEAVPATLAGVKKLALGQKVKVPALFGFTNVKLSNSSELKLPWGVLRSARPGEVNVVPRHLEGQLGFTDEEGTNITVNLVGDVVLQGSISMKLLVEPIDETGAQPRPPGTTADQEQLSLYPLLASTAITLAVARGERPVIPVPTWYSVLRFGTFGTLDGWNDISQGVGMTPAEIAPSEHKEIERWAEMLGGGYHPRLSIPLSRASSALRSRRDATDRLIDAAIALDSLFGAGSAAALRVSGSVAWLLAPDDDVERAALQAEVDTLYAERSKVVHGGKASADFAAAQRTIDLVLQCLRALLEHRADLIPDPNRGRLLLMGLRGKPTT